MIRVGAQAFQLAFLVGVGMALARLLTPDDFGVYAMVLTLTAFVDNFRDFRPAHGRGAGGGPDTRRPQCPLLADPTAST